MPSFWVSIVYNEVIELAKVVDKGHMADSTVVQVGAQEASSFKGLLHGLDLFDSGHNQQRATDWLLFLIHEFDGFDECRDVHA